MMKLHLRQCLSPLSAVALCLLLVACGSVPQRVVVTNPSSQQQRPPPMLANMLIRFSQQQLGTPYQYGGSSPAEGFDCSGLIHYVHARSGLYVPRSTDEQFSASTAVPLDAIRPGDLLFFRIGDEKPSHVGIHTGRGRFIHAPSSGKTVSESSLQNPYWRERLVAAGRFI